MSCLDPDRAGMIVSFRQDVDEANLEISCGLPDGRCRSALFFEVAIHPRDKKEIASPGLDGAGTRKHHIGECVADARNAELIPGVLLAEEINSLLNLAALLFGMVNPSEGGHQIEASP